MHTTSVVAAILALTGLPLAADAGPALVQPDGQVLYDQTDDAIPGSGVLSQNFENSWYDYYDSQAADDFIVLSGQTWDLTRMVVRGHYGGREGSGSGPADSEHIVFYRDRGGMPGEVVATAGGGGLEDGAGNFSIGLWVRLRPGTYWVSVQINMDSEVGGLWYWDRRRTVQGHQAVWSNPDDGWSRGCREYTKESICFGTRADHLFALKGTLR
jgi:hypothetical protein